MTLTLVREGPSGIVELSGGLRETYIPDYDLDQALALLDRVYELRDATGTRLRDNYWDQGFNWLSAQINFLYSRCIYRFVQYRRLLERLQKAGARPVFREKNNFHRVWSLLHPFSLPKPRDFWPFRVTLPAHNRRTAREERPDFLFYRYGPKDFRTAEMLAHFEQRGASLAFVYTVSRNMLKQRDNFGHPVYFLYDKLPARGAVFREYDLSGFDALTARFLRSTLRAMDLNLARQKVEYALHLENLTIMRPKLFFALEDLNRLHPLLFACKALDIPSLGYQTGTYSGRQAANSLPGWKAGEFQYFDHLIVWGRYWEDVCRKHSEAFAPDFFIPGANKHSYGYRRLESPNFDPKNVLVPYEYLANTAAVGQYIMKLQELGYRVHFKLKPDWDPARQLEPYRLPAEAREKLALVETISDEFMATINIVAGTMTTLLFDLLPYGKETWLLETDYRLLDDLAAFGYARKVSLADLEAMEPPARADRRLDYEYVFNKAKLADVLDREVLGRLGKSE